MPTVDPSDALQSFQQALLMGDVQLQPGEIDTSIFVHADQPDGNPRLTYVSLSGKLVTAFVNFVLAGRVEGLPCFQIGYAVPEEGRCQGLGKRAVAAAIAEIAAGMGRHGPFYIEAIVDRKNVASQRIAQATISSNPLEITDEISGQLAFQYLRKVEAKP
jgi:RimJ/RimL family protein N-acetyltransferase